MYVICTLPGVARKRNAKWFPARQWRIDDLMARVHTGAKYKETQIVQ
ncbi:hypothetical protein HNQ77_004803 [Silvibacterium bohemicum]|uniref:Uncharacterized protein n=1 Tax=Silvibacterium bohemicum TaxID=1577686 RepID=A0A841JZN9_9BACT|nr:hypothetical protein [Silvibacterium bohemicum]MBB6146822.1 hypothetical protein [Silvibacterium bohemicum]